MKDKRFAVSISQCPFDDLYVQVQAMSDSKKSLSRVSVSKNGEIPFLRKISPFANVFLAFLGVFVLYCQKIKEPYLL